MHDRPLFLETLSRFARELPARYDTETALTELTRSATAVLCLAGAGVTLAEQGRLRFVTAVSEGPDELERLQEERQAGPCREAFDTASVVAVTDVRDEGERWPAFADAASRVGVAGVAGIPMRLADDVVGALNLYDGSPRAWSPEDLAVAQVLADVATSYLVNASTLHQQQQLSEQLQQALESRVVIEQAKGITAQAQRVSVDEAYALLRRHARSHHTSVRAVAEAVVRLGLRVA